MKVSMKAGRIQDLSTVPVHNLIIRWGWDELCSRINQLEKLKPLVGDFYVLFHGHLADVLLVSNVRSKVWRRDSWHHRPAECSQYDACSKRYGRTLQACEARKRELHRRILAFSISHDHDTVRIYGHYPVIDGSNTTFYRHPIRKFDFTELDGMQIHQEF